MKHQLNTSLMEIMHNVVGWFEIPVTDMDRAIRFYEAVFEFKLTRTTMGPIDMALFPSVENSIGSAGSLVYHPEYYQPSPNGTLIYFTAFSGEVSVELGRATAAGGTVLMPKTLISKEVGYMALFSDSEGNRVAIHSH